MSRPPQSRLPAALQPWNTWLGWFDAELAEALGDVVRRLAQLAGPAPASTGRQQSEPDGLGDLRTQGRYERLLMSEWLLADEMPLEFLRRAASSEHLFLAPSLRATPSERHMVAIFDAGPHQLGAPRVAHLAVLILLARRAEQLGGTLRWGLLQQPGQLHTMNGAQSLKKLLKGRALKPGDATAIALWRDALAAEHPAPPPTSAPECWWIGAAPGPQADAPLPNERRLELRPAWSGPMLHATLVTPRSSRQCDLPLPADIHLGALLRGQFAKAAPKLAESTQGAPALAITHRQLSLTRRPLISADGNQVAAFPLEDRAVLLMTPKKRSAGTAPGGGGRLHVHEQQWAAGRALIAAQLNNRVVQGLLVDESSLHFWQVAGWLTTGKPSSDAMSMAIATAAAMPLLVLEGGRKGPHCVLVVDERKRLLAWHKGGHKSVGPAQVAERVMAAVPGSNGTLFYVYLMEGALWLQQLKWDGQALVPLPEAVHLLSVTPLASGLTPLFFSLQPGHIGVVPTAYAAQTRQSGQGQTWIVESDFGPQGLMSTAGPASRRRMEVELSAGQRAVGLVCRGRNEERQAGLLVMSTDRKTLSLASAGSRTPVFNTPTSIAQAVVCPGRGRVAIITEDRSLHFIEGSSGDVVARLTYEEAPDQDNSQHDAPPGPAQGALSLTPEMPS